MIWSRTILDGVVMCVIFNVTVALLWILSPNSFSRMLPSEIQKVAPKRTMREILVLACVLYPLYIGLIAYAIISAYQAGASGFWNLFWMGYLVVIELPKDGASLESINRKYEQLSYCRQHDFFEGQVTGHIIEKRGFGTGSLSYPGILF